jgi:hypothetical protein
MAKASVTSAGLMTAADKIALDELSTAFKNDELGKVQGVAAGDKILSMTDKLISATVGLTYYTNVTGDTPVYEIRLTGKGGEVISTIDAKSFVKDGMLDKVELVVNPANQATGTYLVFTWNTEAGVSEPMYVPVTDFVDVYSQGDGITIDNNNVVKVKVKSSDPYLEVTTEGVASKGIDNAILVAKNAVVGTETDPETAVTVYGAKKYASNLVVAHETAVTEALKGKVDKSEYDTFVQNTNSSLANIKVTDIDTTVSNGVALIKSETGVVGVSVIIEDLSTALVGTIEKIGAISGVTVKLGQGITNGAEDNPTEIISANTSVHAAIQILAEQIQTTISESITEIDGGEYITVGGTSTSKTITLNTAKIGAYLVDNSSALKVDSVTGKLSLEWETVE